MTSVRKESTYGCFGCAIGILIIILLPIYLLSFIDWGFLKSEITKYPVMCKGRVAYNTCDNPEFTLRKTTYKVLPQEQEVSYWTEGFDVQKLTNCAVGDRKNWTCRYNDNSAEFGFSNGSYWEVSLAPSLTAALAEREYYVSKSRWLHLKCSNSRFHYLLCIPLAGLSIL